MLGRSALVWAVFALALAVFAVGAHATYNMYWLRGSDVTATIDGNKEFLFISTPPNVTSHETVVDANTEAGIHKWAAWYSSVFPQEVMVSGRAYLWFNDVWVENGVVAYRWHLVDFNPGNRLENTIASSAWVDVLGRGESTSEMLLASYKIAAGHRLKLALEYTANRGNGRVWAVLDKPDSNSIATWAAPNGATYKAFGVSSAAGMLLNLCGIPIGCYSNAGCDDSEVLTKDVCVNAGLCESYCTNTWCDVECLSDADCDDGIAATLDVCENAGRCNAKCVHTVCTVACSANKGCDDSNALTTDTCLFPGTCDAECKYSACQPSCSTNADCADGDAKTTDLCVGAGTCDAECKNLASCGNKACDEGESKCSCPGDCGTCGGDVSLIVCREYSCRGAECSIRIKEGCCGNYTCEDSEDYVSCSIDCKPERVVIEVLDVNAGAYSMRGDLLVVKARVSADSHPVKDANASARGFFGTMRLLNDGRHMDAEANDDVYANYFYVSNSTEEGAYPVFIDVEFMGSKTTKKQNYLVIPKLEMVFATDRSTYQIGDIVKISGFLKKRNIPLRIAVDLNIFANGVIVYEELLLPDAYGKFETAYHSSFLDPEGSWKVAAHAADANGNYAVVTKGIAFTLLPSQEFLDVNIISPSRAVFVRGSTVPVKVAMKDSIGNDVNGASATVLCPSGVVADLNEVLLGTYSGTCKLEWSAALGSNEFKVSAARVDGNVLYAGSAAFDINVEAASVSVEVLEPETSHFAIGEEIEILVRVSYPNGEAVGGAVLNATVNGRAAEMQAVESGMYSGKHLVRPEDAGRIWIMFQPRDPYGNSGSAEIYVDVSGYSYSYYLREHALAIGLGLAVAVAIAAVTATVLYRKKRLAYLAKRASELETVIRDIQQQYFKGILDRKSYVELLSKYELELSSVKKTIELHKSRQAKNRESGQGTASGKQESGR